MNFEIKLLSRERASASILDLHTVVSINTTLVTILISYLRNDLNQEMSFKDYKRNKKIIVINNKLSLICIVLGHSFYFIIFIFRSGK